MKKRNVKTILLSTLLILILILIFLTYHPISFQTTGNVVRDVEKEQSPGNYICEDSTILYLPFDTDFNDKSNQETHISYHALELGEGKFSNSSIFNKQSTIDIPLTLSDTDVFISLWLKLNKSSSEILTVAGDDNLSLKYKNGLLASYANNIFLFKPIDNNWHNIIFILNAKEIKVLIDNQLVGLTSVKSFKFNSIILGSNFSGQIDDLFISSSKDFKIEGDKPACISIPACIDSDKGINQNEKGITITKDERKEDYCLLEEGSLKYVNEYYCLGSEITSKVMDCGNGCFDGACIA